MYFGMLLLQSQVDQAEAMKMAMGMLALLPIFLLIGVAIVMVPCWFICKKAGFSPWLSLLNLIPIGNLVLLYILAFGEWKVVAGAAGRLASAAAPATLPTPDVKWIGW